MGPDRLNDQLLTVSDAPIRCGVCQAEILGTGIGPFYVIKDAVEEHWRVCPGAPPGEPARARAGRTAPWGPPPDRTVELAARIRSAIEGRIHRRAEMPAHSKDFVIKTAEIGTLRLVLSWIGDLEPGDVKADGHG